VDSYADSDAKDFFLGTRLDGEWPKLGKTQCGKPFGELNITFGNSCTNVHDINYEHSISWNTSSNAIRCS
jgi:hypothetical protein